MCTGLYTIQNTFVALKDYHSLLVISSGGLILFVTVNLDI